MTKGTKVARGYYADNGPPTTLSNTGKDISLSYQNFTAFDNVQFVNGNQLGRRALLQVWKSVGGEGQKCGLEVARDQADGCRRAVQAHALSASKGRECWRST